ncbi:MAG: octanoyltransferase [Deltaproteobacteria bacterium]|nr:MAG: octanoyltransferase [Deltaproteobacteria bacterium]RLC16697.1 MAG: octanoyltransferase [Deltaproteobacteria bacterium]
MVRQQSPTPIQTCWCLDLQTMDYSEAWEFQQAIVRDSIGKKNSRDIILLVEHPPVFTLGRRGGIENLTVSDAFLKTSGIQVIQVERGGDITYHGPGQMVIYPILDLDRQRLGITELVFMLEEIMIRVSESLGVQATRNPRNRGVWVGDKKLGSVGLAVRKGISFHGIALNVNLSMTPFKWIHPCGLMNISMTSLARELPQRPSMQTVRELTKKHLGDVFGLQLEEVSREMLGEKIGGKGKNNVLSFRF